jgi:hypothetical protein
MALSARATERQTSGCAGHGVCEFSSPLVQRLFPWRACLPTAMDPEPLVRMLANDALQYFLNARRVRGCIACHLDDGVEPKYIFPLGFRP